MCRAFRSYLLLRNLRAYRRTPVVRTRSVYRLFLTARWIIIRRLLSFHIIAVDFRTSCAVVKLPVFRLRLLRFLNIGIPSTLERKFPSSVRIPRARIALFETISSRSFGNYENRPCSKIRRFYRKFGTFSACS